MKNENRVVEYIKNLPQLSALDPAGDTICFYEVGNEVLELVLLDNKLYHKHWWTIEDFDELYDLEEDDE